MGEILTDIIDNGHNKSLYFLRIDKVNIILGGMR